MLTVNHVTRVFTLSIVISADSYPSGILDRLRVKSLRFLIKCEFCGEILSFHNTIPENNEMNDYDS